LKNCAKSDSPCREAYWNWGAGNGRSSWDPINSLIAVRGAQGAHLKEKNQGINLNVDEWGNEHWNWNSNKGNISWVDFQDNGSANRILNDLDNLLCQTPGKPTPPPKPTNWTVHQGRNCWGSRNGQPAHGADDLENPTWSSAGQMTLAQCKAKCQELNKCNGITVQNRGNGQYDCYRKHVNNINQCDAGTGFDTYTWNNHASFSEKVIEKGEKLVEKMLDYLN